MGFFESLFQTKTVHPESNLPANPLHDALFVTRTQKFDSDPIVENQAMMVGDSITAGAENFPTLFPNVYNEGIPGDTTVDLRKRLNLIKKRNPQKIFLLIGTNNIGAWIDSDTTMKQDYPAVTNKLITDYIEILNYFKNNLSSSFIYVQSILPINPTMPGTVTTGRNNLVITQLNQVLAYCPYLYPQCRFINLYPKFLDATGAVLDPTLTDDGLHPNQKGYEMWSSILTPFF